VAILFMLSQVAGMTGIHYPTQRFTGSDWDLLNFLPRLSLNLERPDLRLQSSYNSRCEPLCQALFLFFNSLY
jgi:hypothetical protein